MTTSELIKKLKKYPPNMRVIIHGYEGYDDVESLYEKEIVLNFNPERYCSPHADANIVSPLKRENRRKEPDEIALLVSF